MVQVRYKALDASGRFTTGTMDGVNEAEIADRLTRAGHVVLETASGAPAGERSSLFSFTRRASGRDVTTFLSDLALVLRAGLPLDEALDLVASEEGSAIAAVARDLRHSVTGGASLAEAMAGCSARTSSPWCGWRRPPARSTRCCARSPRRGRGRSG